MKRSFHSFITFQVELNERKSSSHAREYFPCTKRTRREASNQKFSAASTRRSGTRWKSISLMHRWATCVPTFLPRELFHSRNFLRIFTKFVCPHGLTMAETRARCFRYIFFFYQTSRKISRTDIFIFLNRVKLERSRLSFGIIFSRRITIFW